MLGTCLDTPTRRSATVDAYLAALCVRRQLDGVFSFDREPRKLGVELLPIG